MPEIERILASPAGAILVSHGFDVGLFRRLRAQYLAGELHPERNRITHTIEAPEPAAIVAMPPPGSAGHKRLTWAGLESISKGEVGAVLLNGGMATRFGGMVKGAVHALPGRSFLGIKLDDAEFLGSETGAVIPVYLMNSFATDAATRSLPELTQREHVRVRTFTQKVMLRLTAAGDVYLDERGEPSPYAPGHGDLAECFAASGLLAEFQARGGRVLMMSNVDNAAATLDPALIGLHLERGAAVTVENVEKRKGDAGGTPARVRGKLQIVEAFRFPRDFAHETIGVFNTNTLWFDAAALGREYPLTWFAVEKTVGGTKVIQMERLIGELTAHAEAEFIIVPRDGAETRFLPVKTPEDLPAVRPLLEAVVAQRVDRKG